MREAPSLTSQNQPLTKEVEPVGQQCAHALIFTGHMIDAPGRTPPRFPAWAEPRVRGAIFARISSISWTQPGTTLGLAGAASGGDLMFHECCEELGIPTRILLALPAEEFIAESVAPGGAEWVSRFHAAIENSRAHTLHVMKKEDGSLEGPTNNIWQRANLWMIEQAAALASEQALLALWDGRMGDGPGGTEHFLHVAQGSGIRVLPPIQMQTLIESRVGQPPISNDSAGRSA